MFLFRSVDFMVDFVFAIVHIDVTRDVAFQVRCLECLNFSAYWSRILRFVRPRGFVTFRSIR